MINMIGQELLLGIVVVSDELSSFFQERKHQEYENIVLVYLFTFCLVFEFVFCYI